MQTSLPGFDSWPQDHVAGTLGPSDVLSANSSDTRKSGDVSKLAVSIGIMNNGDSPVDLGMPYFQTKPSGFKLRTVSLDGLQE